MKFILQVLFAIVFVQQSFAAPPTPSHYFIKWPFADVHFGVVRLNAHEEGLAILKHTARGNGFFVRKGKASYLPYDRIVDNAFFPDTRALDIPEDHPYQLVAIENRVFVLDSIGWAVPVPGLMKEKNLQAWADLENTQLTFSFTDENGNDKVYSYYQGELYEFEPLADKSRIPAPLFDPEKLSVYYDYDTLLMDEVRVSYANAIALDSQVSRPVSIRLSELRKHPEVITMMSLNLTAPTALALDLDVANRTKAALPSPDGNKENLEPADKLQQLRDSKKARATLVESLKSEIYGQDGAIERIAAQYSEAQKNNTGKPKVLVAMGPSGSGKTFTAVQLAKLLHNGKVLEISGNEFRAHAGSLDYTKLLGSHNGDGKLTKFAKENPNGFTFVINEGEKMHPDIWLMLMEFFDAGTLTDSRGEKVTVKNLWIVITSNRGAKRMFPSTSKNWTQAEIDRRIKDLSQEELQGYFQQNDGLKDSFQLPPEIIKRIDEFIAFGPFTREAAVLMAKRASEDLNKRYTSDYAVSIQFQENTLSDIALSAMAISNDARTVSRTIRSMMSEILDRGVDDLELKPHDVIEVSISKDELGHKQYKASANQKSIVLPGLTNPLENPLLDPDLRHRLRNMKQLMSEIVVGQEGTINEIADAVLSHYGRGKPTRPFSAYLIGVSGNGKTETGRAMAKVIYGDPTRFNIISMGNVSSPTDFDRIFGSSAQFQGGDIEREFEKALRENPNGSVIVLDEVSNMGGGDISRKTALFQKLYELLEEGRYVSPIDGREYELKNYQFLLTGNDGEHLFRGITSDDLIMETWKLNRSQERVRQIMVAAGIPNAFTNRPNVISLTKPLLSTETAFVAQKLWERQIKNFVEANPGIEIVAGKGLTEQMAKSFFTADQGGRSVRKILEDKVGSLILYSLMNVDANLANLKGYKVVINLTDSAPGKPYRLSKNFKRAVEMTAEVYKDGQLIHTEKMDLTAITPEKVLPNKDYVRAIAFHEAGHAVANLEEVTGQRVRFISVRGGNTGQIQYYGYASYESVDTTNIDHQQLVARIARLYAGRKAQEMAGYPADAGWAQDLEQMRKLATLYLVKWGLDPEFRAIEVNEKGEAVVSGRLKNLLEERINGLINEGEALAAGLLKKRWRQVRAVTAELLLRGEIKRETYEKIMSQVKDSKPYSATDRRRYKHVPLDGKAVRCEALFKPAN